MTWIQAHFLGDPIIAGAIIVYIALLLIVGLWASMRPLYDTGVSVTVPCGVIIHANSTRVAEEVELFHLNACQSCIRLTPPEQTTHTERATVFDQQS